ncbi:hypothetical protein BRE01_50300 [Brevibacillus reuszeri]|uniref:Uncharacterized protein n=1 Tax=Brevibacillus reuszeri TaxID=54915 RepID=A0A0K9YLT4_9BACL|nr:hypothetical protein [Brevibacillus reuszeri]KNB69617.1 hypothetical protein ADS79_27555 [Brevibacillus reuszeri]MED1856008.1 hypothetical protein [Brevibacillus reuszeri]GED71328.1 hypothetical protein BRE01_50300 [Brevibacillus reuszeri]
MLKKVVLGVLVFGFAIGITAFYAPSTFSSPFPQSQAQPPLEIDQVKKWIQQQSLKKDHYLEELAFQEINLDQDEAAEVVATITGGAHLGTFFLFDKQANGSYQLISEQSWKIDSLDLEQPVMEIGDKRIYQIVHHSGGTGVSVDTAVLWYVDKGRFVEAWSGELKEVSTFQEEYYVKYGSYYVDGENLYYSTTSYKRPDSDTKAATVFNQKTSAYTFNGTIFEAVTK